MTSHQVAKILLENPDAPIACESSRTINDKYWFGGANVLREITSITYTNHGQFIDKNGDEGNDYNSGRECVEIK